MEGALAVVSRNPTVGAAAYDADANAAHQNALMWCLTGERAYADKAIALVNAWTGTITSIGGRDAVLMAGLGPFKIVQAAELLRYSQAGWPAADAQRAERHLREVVYPVLRDYAPFAIGNWDAAALKAVMAIAIYCNDRPMYEDALRYPITACSGALSTRPNTTWATMTCPSCPRWIARARRAPATGHESAG